jgi:hypothetical protein
MYSSDGAETWSDMMHTGDHGMWDIDTTGEGEDMVIDTVMSWGGAQYDFGCMVDASNNLHFMIVLDLFSDEYNPFDRVNGLYDVAVNTDGDVTYSLIAESGDMAFTFSDGGKDADGNWYAIVQAVITEGEESSGTIYAYSKAPGGEWSEAYTVVEGIDATHNYPHMTAEVGEYFFVIYEIPTEDPEAPAPFPHFVAMVPAAMDAEATIMEPGAGSGVYYSYYVGAVNAIAQDVADGFVYITVRNEDQTATTVANYDIAGDTWTIEAIGGAQRYPSMMMQPDDEMGGMPWVFSNFGVGEAMHKSWYSYDALGYNGGDWLPQTELDSVAFDGSRDLLYVNQGVQTSEGRIVAGCNVWGDYTPEGFQVKYTDDMGESWSDANRLWSIFAVEEEATLVGGYITQNHFLAGTDNHVWLAFCGQYGESDFDGPEISDITFSSATASLEEPWVVSSYVTDNLNGVGYVDINWTNGDPADPEAPWDYVEGDSADVDDLGIGTYFFTLPNDTMFGEALENGDEFWFYIFAMDGVNLMSGSMETRVIVGEGVQSVEENVNLPLTLELGQNYPNPFNNSTVIPFFIDKKSDIKLSVYDINGRLVETLYNGKITPGHHRYNWTGYNVSTGVYFYALEVNGQRHISKMTLLR